MKAVRVVLAVIGAIALVLIVATIVVLASGGYDVSARRGHARPVGRLLQNAMERSVHAHARSLTIPAGVDVRDPKLAAQAADDYREMCLLCHGAPGEKAAFWTAGMVPPAPALADPQERRWSDAELYWIIKNGIKDTAMSAFGKTHDEQELWALTALTRQLPGMSAAQFRALSHEAK